MFNNKHILIVGANSEIGINNAEHLIKENAIIHFAARNKDALDKLKTLFGDKHFYYLTSFLNEEDISNFIKKINFKLNGVIFTTGYHKLIAVRLIKQESLDNIIHANFKIPVIVTKALFKNKKINDDASLIYYTSVAYKK